VKRFFQDLPIRSKLAVFVVSSLFLIVILGIAFLAVLKTNLIDAKKERLQTAVEVATGVVEHYYQLSQKGALSESEAKSAALSELRTLRYKGSEYFWVNDEQLPHPVVLMHPTVPSLEGKPATDEKFNCATSIESGKTGEVRQTDGKKNLFQAFAEISTADGSGFVSYLWPKPIAGGGVTQERFAKLSHVKRFQQWNWIIGSGIYVDDVESAFWKKAYQLAAFFAAVGLAYALFGWFITWLIAQPIRDMGGRIKQMADGDLTVKFGDAGKDEVGALGKNVQIMISNFTGTVSSIMQASGEVISTSTTLQNSSRTMMQGAQEQSMQAAQIAAASEEVNQTIADISRNALTATESSNDAMNTAYRGKEVADGAVNTINRVHSSTGELAGMVEKLNSRAQEIGQIVTVIKDIADQTNLLALNAAIEAARAGEQGRGFAVVADEVRKLAERTIKATGEITEKISAVQSESDLTKRSMEDASREVATATKDMREVGDSLARIVGAVQGVKDQITHIASAVEEQAAASGEVTQNIEKTSLISKETEKMAHEVLEEVETLCSVTETLKIASAGFDSEGNRRNTGFVEYNDVFSVKIESIDNQHKQLFRMINDLYTAWRENRPKAAVSKILSGLIDYTKNHFGFEQDLFSKFGYQESREHIAAHESLVRQVLDLKQRFDRGDASIDMQTMTFLKNWLTNHILRTDKRYSAFLIDKGVR